MSLAIETSEISESRDDKQSSRFGVGSLIRDWASDGLNSGKWSSTSFCIGITIRDSPICHHVISILPQLNGIQDPLFISAFLKGEEIAFDCLYREYFPSLSYFANKFLQDAAAAEDLTQDCFVLLWQRRDKLRHITAIKSYLYTTVRNLCLKQLHKDSRQSRATLPLAFEASFEEGVIAAETARELYQLIDSLSPALRQIIRLYYLEGKSNHEIAKELNIEPDTVIRQRLRAILALRKTKISL